MEFGIYPGGAAGDDRGGLATGPPDHPAAITGALTELQGESPFLVRAYVAFSDGTDPAGPHPTATPAHAEGLLADGRTLDLVAQYWSRSGDVDGFASFVEALVAQYGAVTSTLQITEEPDVTGTVTLDGDYPRVREAIVAGVGAADRVRPEHLRVGFNTTPLFGPAESFVADLVALGGDAFARALDYVGLDFFPDVFSPIGPDALADAVTGLLGHQRGLLDAAGLDHAALRITENGWPTTTGRSPARQAQVLETVARAAHTAGLDGYTHFSLRDADSDDDGLFHRFGLMTSDYVPKPAFGTYRALVAELGAARSR